jgi:CRP-like cAMP-binding protein
VISLPAGAKLFNRGDTDNRIIYLLEGAIELRNIEQTREITSGTEEASLPLDPHQPRKFAATITSDAQIIHIDRSLLDILLTWDPYSNYSVADIYDDQELEQDWMTSLLMSKIFQKIPPVNIQTMFQKLTAVPAVSGDIIFFEGDTGDDCYFIRSGECEVIKLITENELHTVATLRQGQCFGEEALLANSSRNATVRMSCDGTLLRLRKTDFEQLLKSPVIQEVDFETAEEIISQGAFWIDVRQIEEYSQSGIPNSLHIPLGSIRETMHELDASATYILYCDTGQRSACAAYLMNASGFTAYILKDGLQSLGEMLQFD